MAGLVEGEVITTELIVNLYCSHDHMGVHYISGHVAWYLDTTCRQVSARLFEVLLL